MKILISIIGLLLVTQAVWVQALTEDELQSQLTESKHVWLVYRACKWFIILEGGKNADVVERVGGILKGFFKIAVVSSSQDSLSFYGDDR